MGSEQHLNKTCQTVISSTICQPSAASGRVPECLGCKLKCVELHITGAEVGSNTLLGLGLTEGTRFLLPGSSVVLCILLP